MVLLDGGWNTQESVLADERRLYYVGMARAEQALTLCEFADSNPFSHSLTEGIQQSVFTGERLAGLETPFQQLTLKDIDIGFSGRHASSAKIL